MVEPSPGIESEHHKGRGDQKRNHGAGRDVWLEGPAGIGGNGRPERDVGRGRKVSGKIELAPVRVGHHLGLRLTR